MATRKSTRKSTKRTTFTLRIEMDNAAFGETDDEARDELARILKLLGTELPLTGADSLPVQDANGNRVGKWIIAGRDAR